MNVLKDFYLCIYLLLKVNSVYFCIELFVRVRFMGVVINFLYLKLFFFEIDYFRNGYFFSFY